MDKCPPNCKHEYEAKEQQTPGQKWAATRRATRRRMNSCPYAGDACPIEHRLTCAWCQRLCAAAIDHFQSEQKPKPQQPPAWFLEAHKRASEKAGYGDCPFTPKLVTSDRMAYLMVNAALDAAKEVLGNAPPHSIYVTKRLAAIDALKVEVADG